MTTVLIFFWQKVTKMADELEVSAPQLPRQRKIPKRYEDGTAPAEFHATVMEHYRQIYFEGFDLITETISNRFDQTGYRAYRCLENLVIKAANSMDYTDDLKSVVDIYGEDINESNLKIQLETLASTISEKVSNVFEVKQYLTQLSDAQKVLLNEIINVMKLIMVMPATNSTSERSFSAMRRVKSYDRQCMTQERMNNLMILNVHKELTEEIDLFDIAKEFISGNESRENVFGRCK